MTRFSISFLIIFIQNFVFAQNFELGKVTSKELQQKIHPTDSSAVAVILFKKAHTTFKYVSDVGFETHTEFKIKLKIYKNEGLSYANFTIPFYIGYKDLENEAVKIESGYTYTLENNAIVKTKVTGQGKFENKENEYWANQIVTFPNVKLGSIIELKYVLKSQNLMTLPDFQFQYNIPVDKAIYITEIPENYLYKSFKSALVEVSKNEVFEEASQTFEDKFRNSNFVNYKQIKAIYEVNNVPAVYLEPQIKYSDNFYGNINHELQTIRYPEKEPKQISTTWDDVSKYLFEAKEFGKELAKSNYFAADLSIISQNPSLDEVRIYEIYKFVKNKMSWNGKNSIFTRNKIENCYRESTGNTAEINLILIAMLQKAGFKALPVLSSTRTNGFAAFPNTTRLNYVIAQVIFDGKTILLDATCKFCEPKILPTRALNFNGICIGKNETPIEISMIPQVNAMKTNIIYAKIDTDANISGRLRIVNSGQNAVYVDESNSNVNKDLYLEKLEKEYNLKQLANYEKTVAKGTITENFDFSSNSLIDVIGNQLFLNPLLFFTKSKNPFLLEKRLYPVDFVFPTTEKTTIILEIPANFEVQLIPKSFVITLGNDLGKFDFKTSVQGNQIQIAATFSINTDSIDAVDYENLKVFFKKIVEKQNEKIVLKKI